MMHRVLGFLACMVAMTCAMTTTKAPPHHGHHGTHPPPIGEGFIFRYDPNAHRMAVVNNHQCWIYHPSDDEQRHIKDIHVLRNLEAKLIQLVDNTPHGTPLPHGDLALMSVTLSHICKIDWPIITLN
ncbi:uncharacterized protein LOC117327047 [Pecten maximus]|uniref:uncharacterized protein LOC117327047 n=1 Tax=Pecten maximus TaxID=6579 RepID=UPI001458D776|nr:uncharacterized protein LOC117327047 [Pecten maximus]